MQFTELDTPALAVDLDVLERNISTLQSACDALEIDLRAHTKTHKTPEIAHMQIKHPVVTHTTKYRRHLQQQPSSFSRRRSKLGGASRGLVLVHRFWVGAENTCITFSF